MLDHRCFTIPFLRFHGSSLLEIDCAKCSSFVLYSVLGEGAEEACKPTATSEERQKRPVLPATSLRSGEEQRQKDRALHSFLGDNRLLELGRKWELSGRWGLYKAGASHTDVSAEPLRADWMEMLCPSTLSLTTGSVPHLCVSLIASGN